MPLWVTVAWTVTIASAIALAIIIIGLAIIGINYAACWCEAKFKDWRFRRYGR